MPHLLAYVPAKPNAPNRHLTTNTTPTSLIYIRNKYNKSDNKITRVYWEANKQQQQRVYTHAHTFARIAVHAEKNGFSPFYFFLYDFSLLHKSKQKVMWKERVMQKESTKGILIVEKSNTGKWKVLTHTTIAYSFAPAFVAPTPLQAATILIFVNSSPISCNWLLNAAPLSLAIY